MFAVCYRLLNHREDAEDVLQESFISAFGSMENFRSEASFGVWLKRIVINKSLNHLKKKKLTFESLNDQIVEDEEVELKTEGLTVEIIKQTLAEMPDGYRLVFSLYYFEELSHKEIAQELGITESGSKSQLNRAKQRLKQQLEQQGYGK
jgi:RNA polymerase sigma-70 factor (ECF subfamily)